MMGGKDDSDLTITRGFRFRVEQVSWDECRGRPQGMFWGCDWLSGFYGIARSLTLAARFVLAV
jgi:hypothetical protein